ncbi:MAG: diguanylate cyclase [Nanoarchaeota archaeon]|nr:diguanylate cyclase [DPANN group archaeon]MBL7116256.1 diguanylate cyclase [Nanoarchaeota archaeon]
MVKEEKTVLVVEDHPAVLKSLEECLTDQNYSVVTASNGQEALEKKAETNPDIIITDLSMSVMDGKELIIRVRETDNQTPIIVLSGKIDNTYGTRLLKQGASDYMIKPPEIEELVFRIEKELEIRNLRERVITDDLTGLHTKGFLEDRLTYKFREIERSVYKEKPYTLISLIVLDANGFKQINDTYGHVKGDEVLREIGKILRGAIRPSDVAGRCGGDEFMVMVDGKEKAAQIIIERINKKLSQTTFKANNGLEEKFKVTLSYGVAEYTPEIKSPEQLIEIADQRMYEDKRRNNQQAKIVETEPIQTSPETAYLK